MPDPLHCLDEGSGRPVFLLHAFPLSHTMWEHQVHALARRYRLIAPDAFGFGKTPPTPTMWSFADLASGVIATADSLRLTSFVVVGLSMGGYVAFELWRQAPERIEALVLANTRARADTPREQRGRNQLAAAVEREGVGLLADRMLGRLLGRNASTAIVENVRNEIHKTHPSVIGQALAALRNRNDSTAMLERIECPTLVVARGRGRDNRPFGSQSMGQDDSWIEIRRASRCRTPQQPGESCRVQRRAGTVSPRKTLGASTQHRISDFARSFIRSS